MPKRKGEASNSSAEKFKWYVTMLTKKLHCINLTASDTDN